MPAVEITTGLTTTILLIAVLYFIIATLVLFVTLSAFTITERRAPTIFEIDTFVIAATFWPVTLLLVLAYLMVFLLKVFSFGRLR
jgi:hypothetical protein